MFLLFFLLWLLLSGGISVHTCLWGVAVSALISWFCKRVLGYQWRVFCGSPSRIWAMARYFAHLLAEMLKAGLVIMRIIYTRPKGIEPKLVWFHTPLKTDRRRAMLADSITLTAGTITVRAEDGRMLVHTLDTPLAEGIEDSSFQQRLERMEQVRTWVLTAGAVVLALLILATLVRAVLGPRFTDRIVAVNVISTLVIAELVLLSVWLREDFLVDVALVFALLSFLAVVVVSRLVAARRRKRPEREKTGGNAHDR